jgi:hypothetical protein
MARFSFFRPLALGLPGRDCAPEPTSGNARGDLAQLDLCLGRRHWHQRPHLAVRQAAIGEGFIDHVEIRERVTDPQPIPRCTDFDVESSSDPVRTRRRAVDRPLPRTIERSYRMHEPALTRRQVPTGLDDLGSQRRHDLRHDRHPHSVRCSSSVGRPSEQADELPVSLKAG